MTKYTPRMEVRRVQAREDLLQLAADADVALGIVGTREELPRRQEDEPNLFALALSRYLEQAATSDSYAIRSQSYDYAGTIVRFCEAVGLPMKSPHTAEELHAKAVEALQGHDYHRDLVLGVFHEYRAVRNLRLAGSYEDALGLSMKRPADLFGTGAEAHGAHFNYEVGMNLINLGQAAQVSDALSEWETYWESNEQAQEFSTRYLFPFVHAIAEWDQGDDGADVRVKRQLRQAIALVREHDSEPEQDGGARELSVTLALAEHIAAHPSAADEVNEAVRLGLRALEVAERVRGRWRVIARSRAPLALAFRRIYGDIAQLAARLQLPDSPGGDGAAELGLRVALSAKQTGFASLIRTGRMLTSPVVNDILDEIVELEAHGTRTIADTDRKRAERFARLHFDLQETVSSMLADIVLPPTTELEPLLATIGSSRYALDYLELPDTLNETTTWFRTLIRPGRAIGFEQFDRGPALDAFIAYTAARRKALGRDDDEESSQPVEPQRRRDLRAPGWSGPARDWRALAREVLPATLLDELEVDSGAPVELLISAHSVLGLLPWAALKIDDAGTRLVQRTVITQCPMLTCLDREPAPTGGTALLRLVATAEKGVDISAERAAWRLGNDTDRVPLSSGELTPGTVPIPYEGTLLQALRKNPGWQFLHVATHGSGEGLNQYLYFPEGTLTAGQALSVKWPTSVLMASCHVGLLMNPEDAEPLNFVMALLTGGSHWVVAGIDSILDELTGEAASRIIEDVRTQGLSLHLALRNAQLAAIESGAPEEGWALLSAYTR